ncbi:MAG: BamA/TamA family outer membrane protein [Bdellovibrionaceae bacterium]|nr:BamA/TamA family outer membrane protein [Pseudobdellovibrionaceae bacterium]MBX3033183.1 BamA/TamA family outer membrane protein [Pseudobdellovibrionaceae bacterium]
MRRTGLFLLAWLIGGALAQAAPRAVDLSALPAPQREELLKTDPNLAGKSLSLEAVDELLRSLQRMPGVEKALVVEEDAGGPWKLEVRLARRIAGVRFTGLDILSESAARGAFGLAKGDTYQVDALIEAATRLRNAYKDRGALNPIIDIETPEETPGLVQLNVKVNEGAVTVVRDWRVESANGALNERLKRLLEKLRGAPYTEDRLQNAQNILKTELRTKGYLRAELTGPETQFSADETSAVVTFRVDKPESYSVDFRGNKALSSRFLEEKIIDLKNFFTVNPSVGNELAEKIRQAYLQRGYARVETRVEENEGSTPFSRKLLLIIDEGPQIRLEKIDVRGRISRPPEFYAEFIQEHSSKIVDQGFYNKDDLETGFKNLVLELQNEGYLVAKIISTRTQYNRDRSKITLHVNMDEGPLTLVDGISFEGNFSFPSAELQGLLDLRAGEALRLNEIEKSKAALKNFYQEHGFIEMQILNESGDLVTYNEDNTRAELLYRIQEGPQVRVASILLDGNTFTKDYVIMNELDFEVGELLTPSKIEETVSRLQRTGYFGSVEVKTLEEKTAVANRTVIVRVTERNPGLFTIGVGATNENELTIRGYTGIGYRNLFGTGRGVSARVEANYNTKLKYLDNKVVLGYLEPYLFNTRNRFRANVSRSKTIVDYTEQKVEESNQTTYSIERDFTSHVTGIWDVWSLGTYNNTYLNSNRESKLDIASTILRLDVDYRDNPFNPSKGSLSKLSVEFSSPKIGSVKSDEYWRSTASATHYWTFWNPGWVWANSLRGGYLQSVGHGIDGGVPYDKVGFVLGGRSTLRGYEAGTDEVFPNNNDLGGTDTYKLLTSATMGLLKSEVRFPIWGEIGGSVFYDGGTVRIVGLNLPDDYRDSTGFGFHYNTPVGPLNVEFGWKLKPRPNEAPWRFHLSIGTF